MSERQRVLLLTGASRGIGHATVKTFEQAGWRVLTISRQAFDPRCPWEGGRTNHIQLDLADIDAVQRAMPRLHDIIGGGLDALINNAAISPKRPDGGKISALEMAYADWLHIFNVNFFSCMALVQGLRGPLATAQGAVVNMSSIVGSRVHPFASAAYATSKAALWALTRELADDFGHIRRAGECGFAGRDRHRHPVAGHRRDRAAKHSVAPAGQTEGSGGPAAVPVLADRGVYLGFGNPYRRRAAGLVLASRTICASHVPRHGGLRPCVPRCVSSRSCVPRRGGRRPASHDWLRTPRSRGACCCSETPPASRNVGTASAMTRRATTCYARTIPIGNS